MSRFKRIRLGNEILEVRIKESPTMILYRGRANLQDKKAIKRILKSLSHFGVDVREIINLPEDEKKKPRKEEEKFWW